MDDVLQQPAPETECDLPGDWESARLADVSRILSGGTPSKRSTAFWTGTIPWASPKDLKRPYLHDTEDHISEEGLQEGSRLVPAGSLFVVIRGMILSRDVPISMAMVPMAFNQDMKAVVPNGQIDGHFLLYAFAQSKHRLFPEIGTSAHGTRRIGTSTIEDFRVPLPSLAEQRAIAHVLRTVQRAREATEKTLAAVRQLKASLMRHMFTYGLVPVEEADRVDLQQTEFGRIPSHWQVGRIGNHAKVGNGSTPKRTNSGYWDGGTIPWLTSGKVHERIIREADEFVTELAFDECHLPLVKKGSLVIAITGQGKTLGTAALLNLDTCVNQHLAYIQPKDERVVPEFLLAFLHQRYRHFREISGGGGSTKGALTCAFLKGYPIPLPPREEQTEIAEMIEAVERKLAASQARVQALAALFRSLLHHLMTGKIRVGALDPETVVGATP